jgi:beta-galactosidase GanA
MNIQSRWGESLMSAQQYARTEIRSIENNTSDSPSESLQTAWPDAFNSEQVNRKCEKCYQPFSRHFGEDFQLP